MDWKLIWIEFDKWYEQEENKSIVRWEFQKAKIQELIEEKLNDRHEIDKEALAKLLFDRCVCTDSDYLASYIISTMPTWLKRSEE